MCRPHRSPFSRSTPRVEALETRENPSVSIVFDYRFDAQGFFNDPARRAAMDAAAAAIAPNLQDTLSAITPNSNTNNWQVTYTNPATGSKVVLGNQQIPANTIVVYPIGAALAGTELGLASSGLVEAQGSSAFLNQVFGRGQAGALTSPATDYAPWGGFIAFDANTNWSFSAGHPPAAQDDFLSTAEHEMFHLLGFTSGVDSFDRFVSGAQFTGPNVESIAGGPVGLSSDRSHWASGTTFQGLLPTMLPSIAPGQVSRVTGLDFAALQDIGWQVNGVASVPPTVPPAVPPVITPPATTALWSSAAKLAVGADGGSTGSLLNSDLSVKVTGSPVGIDFTGGARVASADVNADGTPDLIAGTGPGSPTQVIVVDGKNGNILATLNPFENQFTGGVYVAAGDIDHDGRADVVITPDRGGGPRVKVYRGSDFGLMADFLGIDDANFRGGARAAVGDMDRDGFADVAVSAGFLGGPRIAGFRGSSVAAGGSAHLFADFFGFETTLRNGAFVALGDVNGDGASDLILGGGPGGAPRVRVVNGAGLLAAGGGVNLDARPDLVIANFFGGDSTTRGGVRVAAKDLDGDSLADVVVGAGDASGSRVTAYYGKKLITGDVSEAFHFDAFPGSVGGVYVG